MVSGELNTEIERSKIKDDQTHNWLKATYVPCAIVLREGEPRGATKAVLAGNFFAALSDPKTKLVRFPGCRFPGILLWCDVTSE